MRYCPECGANVEGVVLYCDCCGAELGRDKKFVVCAIFQMPECLHFDSITRKIIKDLQPINSAQYTEILSRIEISLICYPSSILSNENIKETLRYHKKQKCVGMTLLTNYSDFIVADISEKTKLIATTIRHGIDLLDQRMKQNNLDISAFVTHARSALDLYLG